jgi:hypothetical protein
MNQLAKRPGCELVALLAELIISEGGFMSDIHDDDKKWLKSIFGIDHKAIEKQVTAAGAKAEPPPGPYYLAKAVVGPGERQTYGVVQGSAPCMVDNPYAEHGLTKAAATKRLAELNARVPAAVGPAKTAKKKAKKK